MMHNRVGLRWLLVVVVVLLAASSVFADYYDDSEDHYVPTDERGSIRTKPAAAQPDQTQTDDSDKETQQENQDEKEKPNSEEPQEEEQEETGRKSNVFDDEDEGEEAESIPRSRPAQPSAPVDDDPDIVLPKISYYELLGVPFNPDAETLKKAYRAAALANHPDKFRDPLEKRRAAKLFVRIVAAHDVLSRAAVRRRYDDLLRAGIFDYDYHAWLELMGKRGDPQGSAGSNDDFFFRSFEEASREYRSDIEDLNTAHSGIMLALGAVSMLAFLSIPGYIVYEKSTRKRREIESLTKRVKSKGMSGSLPSSSSSSLPARSPPSHNSTLTHRKEPSGSPAASPLATVSKEPAPMPSTSSYISSFTAGPEKAEKKSEKSFEHVPWTLEEMSLLAKSMQKFPGGTRDRWTAITTFFHNSTRSGVMRSQKEITNKAKELHPDHAVASISSATAAASSLGADIASRS